MSEQPDRENLFEDVTQRGVAIYEGQLRDRLERDHLGAIVAIHVDSMDYTVGKDEAEASKILRARQPSGMLFLRRVGPPTPGDIRLARRMSVPSSAK